MPYLLETLLPVDVPTVPCIDRFIPPVSLLSGKVYERLYGCAGDLTSKGLWDGRSTYTWVNSREIVTFGYGESVDVWRPCLTLNAAGFLSNIYGLDKDCSYRITVDGAGVILLNNLSPRTRGVLWGNHHTGRSNKHPSGYFFYTGFGEVSDQYLINFIKGAVRFEQQLKVEYRMDKFTWKTKYLAFDYLIDGDL